MEISKFSGFSQIFREKRKSAKSNGVRRNIFREIGGKYFSFSINLTKKFRQNDEKFVKLSTTENMMSASAVHCFYGKFNIFSVKSTVLLKS